jgi:hypothetical protein
MNDVTSLNIRIIFMKVAVSLVLKIKKFKVEKPNTEPASGF